MGRLLGFVPAGWIELSGCRTARGGFRVVIALSAGVLGES